MRVRPRPPHDDTCRPLPGADGGLSLTGLFLSRVFTNMIFMTFPAALPTLLGAWGMSGAKAGLVQTAFLVAFALSLAVTSWASDRVGARRVYGIFVWCAAAAALAFALLARSWESALLLSALVGASQGGTYTPAIILVSQCLPPERRGAGVGWILAGMSGGYVLSIAATSGATATLGYEAAFAISAGGTVLGAVFGMAATRRTPNIVSRRERRAVPRFRMLRDRTSFLLTLGYVGHSWELFGVWAWVPAFLLVSLGAQSGGLLGLGDIGLGVAIAIALHLSGFLAALSMGMASDRIGRRIVLVGLAAIGALCSFGFGWADGLPPVLLLLFAAAYGFVTLGDSGVLSAAMTEAVPPHELGRALGLRSILGIGAGALAPPSFGAVLDLLPPGQAWGWAFVVLGLGGALATLCALLLPERS